MRGDSAHLTPQNRMSAPVPGNLSGNPWTSLEPYAQVLRALLPRLSHLSVFNAQGELHWSTEMTVDPEVLALIPDSIRTAQESPASPGHHTSTNHDQMYLFWLRRDDGLPDTKPFAVVALGYRAGPDAERRSFSYVHALVKPAIECLRRELMAREEIMTLHNSMLEQDSDLEMLLSVSGAGGVDNKPESVGDLKPIIASATEHLRAGLSALIIPENGVALVHPSAETPLDTAVLAKAHRHLLSMARARRQAVIANRMELPSGTTQIAYRVLACPVLAADGRAMGVLALFRSHSAPEFTAHHGRVTELLARRIASIIAHSYDALTGLLTRPAFEQRVRPALISAAGAAGRWSALYIDINRLHLINDNCGMHVGDRVIAQIGELIRTRLPPGSIASRISGDRFAILLPAALPSAAQFAESLRLGAEQLGHAFADGSVHISISVGVAAIEPRVEDFVHAFATAETACKAANDRGRNRVELYLETDESIVRRFSDMNLISGLRSAVAEQRLQLNAQFIVPLAAQGVAHFEILLRMIDEKGVIVGPDHFMSAAQRYQLMPTIDRWVIGRAIEMLKPHSELLEAGSIVFTINFSGQSMQDPEFPEHVAKLVEDSGVNPAALCFELTESAAIGNLARAEVLMRRLRKLGCNVALDDFGVGLSSLAYLRTLPIGMLKIDGSFVRDVLKDSRAESLVHTIAQLARAMSLTTVAEHVETDEIRKRITALGVDYAQGFAISRPEPLADVLAELPLYVAAAVPGGVWPQQPATTAAALAG